MQRLLQGAVLAWLLSPSPLDHDRAWDRLERGRRAPLLQASDRFHLHLEHIPSPVTRVLPDFSEVILLLLLFFL